jgi:EmrB/QacA subfamily drug resistance transporter
VRYGSAAARWVIAATVLGSGMAAIDATVVGIALASMGRDLHASVGQLQWVVTGYTLTLVALLLPSGVLGDRLGRRRVFNIGVVWFAAASAVCALAPDAGTLIAMRLLQGVGAALLTPGSLSIIEASFDDDSRGRAIGAWSGLGGLATAAGPLLGGYLIAVASWRWIFVINVPVGAAVLWLSMRHVPESKGADQDARLDVAGSALAVVTLVGFTYALIEGPAVGWTHPAVLALLGIGVAGAVSFWLVERSVRSPMLPFAVFGRRQFTVTNAVTILVYAALGGVLFLLPVELQVVAGYSPLESGLALLPITVIMLCLSARSGRLAGRIGPRLQMSVGPIVVGGGLALLTRSTTDHAYVTGVLPAVVVFGLGLAITVAPLTATAMGALDSEQAGLAAAVNNGVARLGTLIAVATLPAIAGITGYSYLHPEAMASGFRTAVAVGASWCVLGGVVAAVGIVNPAVREAREPCVGCPLEATSLVTTR